MTEWGVFGVIVAVVSFVIAIMAPIIKLNTTITKLNGTMERLREKLDDLTVDNKEAHKRLWDKVDENTNQLEKHEIEIEKLKVQNHKKDPL